MNVTTREVRETDLELIMQWRMDPEITKWMNTDPVLTLERQKKWFEKITADPTVRYWVVELEKEPIGLIYIESYNEKKRECTWGYYIGEKSKRSIKLAISLERSLYHYIFNNLAVDVVRNEPLRINKGVIKLHLLCDNKIDESVKKSIRKNGKEMEVICMYISKNEWEQVDDIGYELIQF